jgi:hypothetical protein
LIPRDGLEDAHVYDNEAYMAISREMIDTLQEVPARRRPLVLQAFRTQLAIMRNTRRKRTVIDGNDDSIDSSDANQDPIQDSDVGGTDDYYTVCRTIWPPPTAPLRRNRKHSKTVASMLKAMKTVIKGTSFMVVSCLIGVYLADTVMKLLSWGK